MANEKRLIDANALFRGKLLAVNTKNPMETVEDLMNRINNAPTVDAVEVVRCKDCKHYHEEIGFCDEHSCFVKEDMEWNMFAEDDFCSYGERKE